jgi:hypothetical protein
VDVRTKGVMNKTETDVLELQVGGEVDSSSIASVMSTAVDSNGWGHEVNASLLDVESGEDKAKCL